MSDMYTIQTSPNPEETSSARKSRSPNTRKHPQTKNFKHFLADAAPSPVHNDSTRTKPTLADSGRHHGHHTAAPTELRAHLAPVLAAEGSITVPLSVAIQHDGLTVSATPTAAPDPAAELTTQHSSLPTTLTVHPFIASCHPATTSQISGASPSITFHTATITHVVAPSSSPSQTSTSSDSPLAVPVIVLMAVGGLCLSGGLLILLRYACWKPQRAKRPIPSKPIPQDYDAEDSPIFGTNGRFSSVGKDETTPPSWTQYAAANKMPSGTSTSASWSSENEKKHGEVDPQSTKKDYPFTGFGASAAAKPSEPTATQGLLPIVQTSRNHSGNQLSAALPSPFLKPPSSAISSRSDPVTLVEDTHPVLSSSKAKFKRDSSATFGTSRASAYGGAELFNPIPSDDATVPQLPAPVPRSASNTSGRARIKTPYTSGHLGHVRRQSSITYVPAPEESTDDLVYSLTDAKRKVRRDTRALTAVLEYAEPSSPHDTLAPDDSISVAARRISDESANMRRRQQTKSTVDATVALGNLMLMDFAPTSSTLRSLKSVPKAASKRGLGEAAQPSVGPLKVQKKPADGPPRVPSPPPMPSLEQMAMKAANPEEYESYRSPTYSLYACYNGDGKNRLTVTTTNP